MAVHERVNRQLVLFKPKSEFRRRDGVFLAKIQRDFLQDAQQRIGCHIAYGIRTNIVLENPHQTNYFGILDPEVHDVPSGVENASFEAVRPATPRCPRPAVPKTRLSPLMEIQQPEGGRPRRPTIYRRGHQKVDDIGGSLAERGYTLGLKGRVLAVAQQQRVNKQLGVRVQERVQKAGLVDVGLWHPELLAEQLGINDLGHIGPEM
jgi:hypothetical protein